MTSYAVQAVQSVPVEGEQLCGLTWRAPLLWYSDGVLEQILAVDPQVGEIVHRIECPEVRTDLTTIGHHLLQIAGPSRSLRVIDPETGEVLDELDNPRPTDELCGLAIDEEGLWMGYENPPLIEQRTWPDLQLMNSVSVDQDVAGMTVIGPYLAFANYEAARVNMLDPETQQIVAVIEVEGNPTGLTWDEDRVWYCDYTNVRLCAVEVPGDLLDD